MNKKLQKCLSAMLSVLSAIILTSNISIAQSDGDLRTRTSGQSWTGTGGSSAWSIYTLATNSWGNSNIGASGTSNVFIRDGFIQTANVAGTLANNVTVGFGGGFRGTANLTGGAISSITIIDGGRLNFLPGVSIFGAATTQATATVGSLKVSGFNFTNAGTGYTTATVTIGNLWTTGISYTANTSQVNSGGNLYTCRTTGLAGATAPTGTGTGISDGVCTWDYAGPAATATANITSTTISSLTIVNEGAGYLAIPGVTITGDGTGASYQAQVGVVSINITNGGAGYSVAPLITMGSSFQVGNATTNRVASINGNLAFTSGATIQTGGPTTTVSGIVNGAGTGGNGSTQSLTISGNLSAVTPISFRNEHYSTASSASFSANTNVIFNKAGTSTVSGAKMTFNNLTVNSGTTLDITNEVVILGNLVNNGVINNSGSLTLFGTNTGSGTIGGSGTLPITLISFNAKPELNTVKVSWVTSSETNNEKFIVEKSTDGKVFYKIAEVKAKGPSTYSILDKSPLNGANYYRLIQYDFDGKSETFGPAAVNFDLKTTNSLAVYPNPSVGTISFTAEGFTGIIEAKLLDFSGRIIHKEKFTMNGEGNYTLSIKQKPDAGKYILQVSNDVLNKSSVIVVL